MGPNWRIILLIVSTFAPPRLDQVLLITHHRVGGIFLLGAAADGGQGGDHDEGEGPGHLAQGGADVVHWFAAQLETVHLEDLVCNSVIMCDCEMIIWSFDHSLAASAPKVSKVNIKFLNIYPAPGQPSSFNVWVYFISKI